MAETKTKSEPKAAKHPEYSGHDVAFAEQLHTFGIDKAVALAWAQEQTPEPGQDLAGQVARARSSFQLSEQNPEQQAKAMGVSAAKVKSAQRYLAGE